MKVVVFGGTGRTGQHVLTELARAGHDITLYGRRAPQGWVGKAITGQLDDRRAVAHALQGADAVVCALGSSRTGAVCLPASRSVIAARIPGLRYITVAGAAVDVPGDAKAMVDRIIGGIFRVLMRKMLAERQAEYQDLAASDLDFTMLRPPMLTDGPATGNWVLSSDTPVSKRIARADVAQAMVAALERKDLIRTAPFIAAAKRKPVT